MAGFKNQNLLNLYVAQQNNALAEIAINPNSDSYVKLGKAQLESSQFYEKQQANQMIIDAIESFGNGIECNNQNAEAYYCRGNVRVALAFRQPTLNQAQQFFLDAAQDFTVGEALVGEEDKPRFVRARERIQIDRETSLYRDFHRHRP